MTEVTLYGWPLFLVGFRPYGGVLRATRIRTPTAYSDGFGQRPIRTQSVRHTPRRSQLTRG